jgi:hypothetical protein
MWALWLLLAYWRVLSVTSVLATIFVLVFGSLLRAAAPSAEIPNPADGHASPSKVLQSLDRHWAFQPPTRAQPPTVQAAGRVRNPIDQFILARLEREKLSLSPEADRRALVRRVYFDVIGLPPSPEDVEAFIADQRQDAYDHLVERLLASPHYGERWARHWLDVVRFAETHGFEMNQPRPNAWPYRDYVIRSFNDDKPYNRFILEQIAGDALGSDEATGFLVGGPWDQVKSPDAVLTANQRADELHDIVSTTASAFLGLTVGCARCHDHKFDPIPQTNYYAIKACFEGVQHGERQLKTPDAEAKAAELQEQRRWLAEVERALEQFEPLAQVGPVNTNQLRSPVHPRRNLERITPTAAKRLRFTVNLTSDAEPCIDELEVYTAEASPRNIALASAGTATKASTVFPNSEIHRLEHINDGQHGNSRSWISNERGKGWVELEFAEAVTIDRIIWGRDREEKFSDRLPIDYRIEVATNAENWQLIASSADRQPYVAGKRTFPALATNVLSAEASRKLQDLLANRSELTARIKELSRQPMVYGGTFTPQPGPTPRFHRGDPMQTREIIEPGMLTMIGARTAMSAWTHDAASADLALRAPVLTEDQCRRLALAEWIANPENPLTARVMVNRLWQYHFGEGLVSTPSDFGINGGRPTHPELLDWLASEFVAPSTPVKSLNREKVKSDTDSTIQPFNSFNHSLLQPWSLKHIHRLILTSATYRQASAVRQNGLAADAGARLLWRFPPRRLEAEVIRDAMLSVSGKLDLKMGGPGFSFFEPNDNYVRVYEPRQQFGPETWRRMIYGTVVRQRPDGVFGVFDCPDAGQIAPKRNRSTTPLQALNLLNSQFVLEQAAFFAERVREAGDDRRTQIRRAFALAFNREPSRRELNEAAKLVHQQGLKVFGRALFNANEFVYLF